MGGALPSIFTVTSLLWLYGAIKTSPEEGSIRLSKLAWYGGIALLFITLIFPMQLNRHWLTVGWAMEGAALFWLFQRVRHSGLPKVGFSLLIICFVRLLWNAIDSNCYVRSEMVFLNAYVFDYLIVLASILGTRKLLISESESIFDLSTRRILEAAGLILLFVFMNLGIKDLFGTEDKSLSLLYLFSGSFAQDMTYTIAWTLFALGLVFLGLLKRIPNARYTGLALIGISLLKLFFHDLVRLDQLYRIGTFIAVAAIMILASFFYQKFMKKSEEV